MEAVDVLIRDGIVVTLDDEDRILRGSVAIERRVAGRPFER